MASVASPSPSDQTHLPGTVRPRRYVPKLHWELIVCGLRGHELVGTDARLVRPDDDLIARDIDGVRWHRCLRCDSWLPLQPPREPACEHPPEREEIVLPLRGRPLRDKIVLRVIAVDKLLHAVVLTVLGVAVLLFAANETALRDTFYRVVVDIHRGFGGGPIQGDGRGLFPALDTIFTLDNGTLTLVAIAAFALAATSVVETVGLWLAKRWAEYLTFVVTALLLPFEIHELIERVTVLRVLALVVNLAVLLYLAFAKRLFGLRGGARAEHAERERDVGWAALERSAPGAWAVGEDGSARAPV